MIGQATALARIRQRHRMEIEGVAPSDFVAWLRLSLAIAFTLPVVPHRAHQ
jgi:hypothetical protein